MTMDYTDDGGVTYTRSGAKWERRSRRTPDGQFVGKQGARLWSLSKDELPLLDNRVTLLSVDNANGNVFVAQTVDDKRAMLKAEAEAEGSHPFMVLAVWPGKVRSDVFLIDDVMAAAVLTGAINPETLDETALRLLKAHPMDYLAHRDRLALHLRWDVRPQPSVQDAKDAVRRLVGGPVGGPNQPERLQIGARVRITAPANEVEELPRALAVVGIEGVVEYSGPGFGEDCCYLIRHDGRDEYLYYTRERLNFLAPPAEERKVRGLTQSIVDWIEGGEFEPHEAAAIREALDDLDEDATYELTDYGRLVADAMLTSSSRPGQARSGADRVVFHGRHGAQVGDGSW